VTSAHDGPAVDDDRGSVEPRAAPEPDASFAEEKMSYGIRNVSALDPFEPFECDRADRNGESGLGRFRRCHVAVAVVANG
jgi:hypothetical protein